MEFKIIISPGRNYGSTSGKGRKSGRKKCTHFAAVCLSVPETNQALCETVDKL